MFRPASFSPLASGLNVGFLVSFKSSPTSQFKGKEAEKINKARFELDFIFNKDKVMRGKKVK